MRGTDAGQVRCAGYFYGPFLIVVTCRYGQFIIGGTLNATYMDQIEQSSEASQEPYYQMQMYYYREKGWYYDVPADKR